MERNIGLPFSRAARNASSPHGYQSTGLKACWRRYGDFSRARRLALRGDGATVFFVSVTWVVSGEAGVKAARPSAAAHASFANGLKRGAPALGSSAPSRYRRGTAGATRGEPRDHRVGEARDGGGREGDQRDEEPVAEVARGPVQVPAEEQEEELAEAEGEQRLVAPAPEPEDEPRDGEKDDGRREDEPPVAIEELAPDPVEERIAEVRHVRVEHDAPPLEGDDPRIGARERRAEHRRVQRPLEEERRRAGEGERRRAARPPPPRGESEEERQQEEVRGA